MTAHAACPMCGYRPGDATADESKLPLRYRKAYRFMLANLREPDLTVDDLAQAAGVTTRALQLAWKKHMRCSPGGTIRRLRAEKIRHEIITSGKTIMRCAEASGIYNRSALAHLFKATFGCSPQSYRGPVAGTAPMCPVILQQQRSVTTR